MKLTEEQREHRLKTWPEYFNAVRDDIKPFEVRKNDRDFQVGDKLILEEYHPDFEIYSGEKIERTITYILDERQFVKEGFVILGLSSEQAWREETERLRGQLQAARSMKQFAITERHETAETRLNQAIEVLKEVRSCIPSMQDESESPSLRHNMGNMIMIKIDEFLSQEGEKP